MTRKNKLITSAVVLLSIAIISLIIFILNQVDKANIISDLSEMKREINSSKYISTIHDLGRDIDTSQVDKIKKVSELLSLINSESEIIDDCYYVKKIKEGYLFIYSYNGNNYYRNGYTKLKNYLSNDKLKFISSIRNNPDKDIELTIKYLKGNHIISYYKTIEQNDNSLEYIVIKHTRE